MGLAFLHFLRLHYMRNDNVSYLIWTVDAATCTAHHSLLRAIKSELTQVTATSTRDRAYHALVSSIRISARATPSLLLFFSIRVHGKQSHPHTSTTSTIDSSEIAFLLVENYQLTALVGLRIGEEFLTTCLGEEEWLVDINTTRSMETNNPSRSRIRNEDSEEGLAGSRSLWHLASKDMPVVCGWTDGQEGAARGHGFIDNNIGSTERTRLDDLRPFISPQTHSAKQNLRFTCGSLHLHLREQSCRQQSLLRLKSSAIASMLPSETPPTTHHGSHSMRIKRGLPASEAEGPPLKRQSSSPAYSPRSPRNMPVPLQDSLDILQHHTSFDLPESPTSRTSQESPLTSAMDVDAPSVPDADDYLPSSPTPRAATDANPEATPPARDREDSGVDRSFDLAALSPIIREKHYRTAFETLVIPLKDLNPPPPCHQYPPIAEEIFEGYLRHATFVARVWINYDAVTQKFFLEPDRLAGCGEMRLSGEKRRYLESYGDALEFGSVCFEIGTPFRVLARMCIDVIRQEMEDSDGESVEGPMERLDVGASLLDPITGKNTILNGGLLKLWVVKIRDMLRRMQPGAQQGQSGLRLQDLDNIARWLMYHPHTQDEVDKSFDGSIRFSGSKNKHGLSESRHRSNSIKICNALGITLGRLTYFGMRQLRIAILRSEFKPYFLVPKLQVVTGLAISSQTSPSYAKPFALGSFVCTARKEEVLSPWTTYFAHLHFFCRETTYTQYRQHPRVTLLSTSLHILVKSNFTTSLGLAESDMQRFKNAPPAPSAELFQYEKLPPELVSEILNINKNRSRSDNIKGQPGFLLVCKKWYDLRINRSNRKSQAYIKITVKAHRRNDELILNFSRLKGDTKLENSRPSSEDIHHAVKRLSNAGILSISMTVDCCEH
ncbi:uncharacterized protein MYCFIDRAFT_176381 [Pseudocercospora fijiensis CIRAD86]|uniref:Uncharacterized protein n=1 Tax=Pseudocercospora fijiensis (strain CIRAD86) TaxID=383855 RepID=M3AV49_PSEFD|nr:uncharacterized protein MYCFIDRAFT_176381 [Pseudocercospora fijiensis CIRAD86]EME81038.1 hypothetical protein MYCFIDRAFT_176381 [Pseudocercospora fijiensis CIRAD86]